MNFFNTLLPSGQTQSSATDLETITENEVAEDELEQVRIASAVHCVTRSIRDRFTVVCPSQSTEKVTYSRD